MKVNEDYDVIGELDRIIGEGGDDDDEIRELI